MHQDEPSDGDETSISPMNPDIDAHIAKIRGKIATAMARSLDSARTSEYTVTDFTSTKQDKLWDMKVKEELVDSVLRTTDGHREFLHLDLLLDLEKEEGMSPFYKYVNSDDPNVKQYEVHPSIDAATLKEIIHFAYKRRCTVKKENALAMFAFVTRFHLPSLGTTLLQPFIEDHFHEIWTHQRADILEMSFSAIYKILSWDRLDCKAETTVWQVMQCWVQARREDRLSHLPTLIMNCLRIGRLPVSSRERILRSELILALSAAEKATVIGHFEFITGTRSECAIIDGYGLFYNKDIIDFRPRGALNCLLVAAGGIDCRRIEVYNSQINMWHTIGLQLPEGLHAMQFSDGVLYLLRRFSGQRQLMALDFTQAAPSSMEKCPIIHARPHDIVIAALNGFLYALGGDDTKKSCERYDPKLDRWELVAELLTKHGTYKAATSFKERLFFASGMYGEEHTRMEMYSPETNTWQRRASMLGRHHRRPFFLVPYGNRLWVLDVANDYPPDNASSESYDLETNSWHLEDITINGICHGLTVFNDQLIIAGGADNASLWHLRSVQKYEQDQGWTEMAPLSHERGDPTLFTVPNIYPSLRP